MNENTKTLLFVAVAVVFVATVWATRPVVDTSTGSSAVGEELFPEFTDPLAATSMEIVKYDEETGDSKTFKVAQVDGIWSIPSYDGYPADAKDQLAEAASSVMALKILDLTSENIGDQQEYGVFDPADKELKPGTVGVGTRVTMKDKDGKELLAMVIGKRDEEQPQLRYVRRVGQDPIYQVKVDTDKLSTKFAEWIKPDLLKLSPWEIRQMDIQDYSVDEAQGTVMHRSEIWLDYDDAAEKDKWKLAADRKFVNGKWVAEQMPAGMELDTKKLDDMKAALDDLKIVDVARKPAGLATSLKENKDFSADKAARDSLMMRGFYPANVNGKPGIYSNEGEFRCLMKDGVEYVLRFGNISESRRADSDEDKDGKKKSGGVNRYIFVMAEFNHTAVPKPKLEKLPEAKKPAAPAKKDVAKKDAAKKDAAKPADAKAADKTKPKADAAAKDKKPADTKADEKKPDDAEKLKAERERIEKENQRKTDEYEEQIAKAKEKVNELNARFADWYYVISNSIYEKIHLGRNDIIVKKKKADDKKADGLAKPPAGLPPMGGLSPAMMEQLKKAMPPGAKPAAKPSAPPIAKPATKPAAKPAAKAPAKPAAKPAAKSPAKPSTPPPAKPSAPPAKK
ncbi:MAG: DUF4340 domain-containing protein [Planctomycetota bacterium]|nr:DUF4340 domain-containing protein [Planctomycetota bacterium]